jgi:FkbM family methyltransferase
MSVAFPASFLEFKYSVLSDSLNGLKLNTFFDNFDAERFNYDGSDRSKSFDTAERVYYLCWFIDNCEELYSAFSLFKAERSKRLFLNLLAFRIAGHHSVRIETLFDENSVSFESYKAIEKYTASSLPAVGQFGKLRHYDFNYNNKHYVADCLGLKYYLYRRQYFFDDGKVKVEPNQGDFVIDAGACLGDTAIVFGKAVGKDGKVFAFDPVENHLEVLGHNINQNPDCNIQAMPFGLADADVSCPPIKLQTYSPGFSSRNQNVPLRCLDSLVIGGQIPQINYVKMDIEGAELSAIKGAAGSIRKFRPKLAISLYHKPTDIFQIPLYIANEFPFYEMFIEHYTIHAEETVLYCVPK